MERRSLSFRHSALMRTCSSAKKTIDIVLTGMSVSCQSAPASVLPTKEPQKPKQPVALRQVKTHQE